MRKDHMKTICTFIFTILLSVPALAGADIKNCVVEHQNCANTCLQKEEGSTQAACVAQCAGIEAQCVGHAELKKGEPFIRKKAEQLENFLNDFLGDFLPKEEITPDTNSREATDT